MSGFEQLDSAIQSPQVTITSADVAFSDQALSDEIALSIVLQDTDTAERYLQSKNLIDGLDSADKLYQGSVKPRTWPNGKPRSSLPTYVVLEAIEKIVRPLHLTLWNNGREPFNLVPTGNTTPAAARAKAKLLKWAIKQTGLKEEMRRSLKTCLQYGFVIGNWGWESSEKRVKTYTRENGKIISKTTTEDIEQPFYRCLDLRRVLIDPACDTQDVRKSAKYVIFQTKITANDLDDLRDDPGYKNVPTREDLAMILAYNNVASQDSLTANKTNVWSDLQAEPDFKPTTADPLQRDLEIIEYWTDDRVITVLERKIVIRNEANEFGRKTQVSCAFVDVLGSARGFGIAKLLSGEQNFQTGVRNAWVDSLALSLNPMFQLSKGMGAGTQQISASPGKVINEAGELKPLTVASVTNEAITATEASDARAKRLVGANGGADMPTQAMRTSEGVQTFTGDVISGLQYFLEMFIDLVFVPVLEAFLELCCDRMPEETMKAILSAEDGKSYEGDMLDVYMATCNIEVLAGTKLTTRQAAAQLTPLIMQLVSNQPVQDSFVIQNKKFNFAELITETLELMGWEIDPLILEMTPADQQRAQQMNTQAVKGQQDQVLEAQKHQNELDSIDAKATAQATVAVIKNVAKNHLDQAEQMLEGQPGATNGQ